MGYSEKDVTYYGTADWHFHWKGNDIFLKGLVYESAFDIAYRHGWQPRLWYKPWTWGNYYNTINIIVKHIT